MAINFVALRASLSMDTSPFKRDINTANTSIRKMGSQMSTSIGKKGKNSINDASNAMKAFGSKGKLAIIGVANTIKTVLIAKVLKELLNMLRQATTEVFKFASSMEQAEIAFTQFLGTEARAKSFLGALEDLAAVTPIQIEPLRQGAQQLLAMRFSAESIIPVLRIVVDTVSALGEGAEEHFNTVVRVLGRIKGTGRVSSRELRSLAAANIPIYDILQKKLGLTSDELRNIGRLAIPAGIAIEAILTGLDEKFNGLAEEMSRTVKGLISTIKDNLLFLGRDVTAGAFNALKAGLTKIRDFLQELRELSRIQGLGAVFEKIIPPELQDDVRLILLAFRDMGKAIVRLFKALSPLIKLLGVAFIKALALLLPLITRVIEAFVTLIEVIIDSEVFMNILNGTILMSGKVTNFLAQNTWSLVQALGTLLGFDVSKLLQPQDFKDGNKGLNEWEGDINDIKDSAEAAGEAIKRFLAPFDEIINMTDSQGGGGEEDLDVSPFFPDKLEVEVEESDIGLIEELLSWLDKLKIKGKELIDFFKENIILAPIFPMFPPFPPLPIADLSLALEAIRVAFSQAVSITKRSFDHILQNVKEFNTSIEKSLQESFGTLSDLIGDAIRDWTLDFHMPTVSEAVSFTMQLIENIFDLSLLGITQKVQESISIWTIDFLMPKVIESISTAWQGIQLIFTFSILTIRGWIKDFLQFLSEKFQLIVPKKNLALALKAIQVSWEFITINIMNIINSFIEWLSVTFTLENAKQTLFNALDTIAKFWEIHSNDIMIIVLLLIAGIVAAFISLPVSLSVALAAIVFTVITEAIEPIKKGWDDLITSIPILWEKNIGKVKTAVNKMRKAILAIIEKPFTLIVDIFSKQKAIKVDKDPETDPITRKLILTNDLKNTTKLIIPGAANGAIINKETFLRVGEGNKKEAVVPLQNPSAMQPFADAVASQVAAIIGSTEYNTKTKSERPIIIQAGTVIADPRSLLQFKRQLDRVDAIDRDRRG